MVMNRARQYMVSIFLVHCVPDCGLIVLPDLLLVIRFVNICLKKVLFM